MRGTGLDGVCWEISVSVGIHGAVPRVECARLPQSHAAGRLGLAGSGMAAWGRQYGKSDNAPVGPAVLPPARRNTGPVSGVIEQEMAPRIAECIPK